MAFTTIDNSLLAAGASGNTFIGMGKNRIINGDMRINQRNASTALSVSTLAANYALDMWWSTAAGSDGVFSVQRSTSTPPASFSHFMRATVTTADASIGSTQEYHIDTAIEGYNMRDFLYGTASAKTSTLSFWVRSNLTGTYGGVAIAGSGLRGLVFSYTINSANTWEQKIITLVGDTTGTWTTDNSAGVIIRFGLALGSSLLTTPTGAWQTMPTYYYGPTGQVNWMATNSNTFDITGVQLELGSNATAFEYRMIQYELALCQRYYEKSYDLETAVGTSTGAGAHSGPGAITNTATVRYGPVYYKVTKRVTPTVSIWNNVGTANEIITTSPTDVNTSRAAVVVTTTTNSHGFRQAVTSTDLYCGVAQWAADSSL